MKPIELPEDHPLYSPLKLRLRTPAIDQLQETLTQWLWTGATGGFIEGPPRSGKTTALKILCSQLRSRQGNSIPCHRFSVPPRDRGTIQSLYRNLCISAGIKLTDKSFRNADVYVDTVLHFLTDKIEESGSDQMILMVDEMQRLHINQIEAFAELHDLLANNDKMLTVFFTGNDTECDKLIKLIESHSRRHIFGRFFTQRSTFDGIRTKAELKACLKQYDTQRYPEVIGPTYTESCLPDDFKEGFLLHSLAPDIWEIYRGIKTDYGIESWGMKFFTSAIKTLLMDMLPSHGVEAFCPEMFEECIRASGLIQSNVRKAS